MSTTQMPEIPAILRRAPTAPAKITPPAADTKPLKMGPPNKTVARVDIAKGNNGVHSKEALRQDRKANPLKTAPKAPPAKTGKGKTAAAAKTPAKKAAAAPKTVQKITALKKPADVGCKGGRRDRVLFVLTCKDTAAAYNGKVAVNAGNIKWMVEQGYIKLS